MREPTYDHDFWEDLWTRTLRDHADKVAGRPPSLHLITCARRLPPGRALDAGCGHGAEALWLAAHGWRVTAIDFSRAALDHARSLAGGVAPGGTLLLVGHRPVDPATGAPTAAAGQNQVSVDSARAALDPHAWTLLVAEERARTHGAGVDAVLCARRVS